MSTFAPKVYEAPQGGGSKMFDAGQVYATIADVKLDFPTWDKKGGGYVLLTLEGPAIEGFEGFQRDRNDPGLGKYEGKTATVKSSNWSFSDFQPKDGDLKTRDEQIKNFLDMIATNMGKMDAILADFAKTSPSLDTIEDYAAYLHSFLVDRDNYGYFTIIGDPYTKDDGKTGMNFFFPRKGKDFPNITGKYPVMKAVKEGEIPADLFALPQADYVKQRVASAGSAPAATQAAPVQAFGGAAQPTTNTGDDSDLPF